MTSLAKPPLQEIQKYLNFASFCYKNLKGKTRQLFNTLIIAKYLHFCEERMHVI